MKVVLSFVWFLAVCRKRLNVPDRRSDRKSLGFHSNSETAEEIETLNLL